VTDREIADRYEQGIDAARAEAFAAARAGGENRRSCDAAAKAAGDAYAAEHGAEYRAARARLEQAEAADLAAHNAAQAEEIARLFDAAQLFLRAHGFVCDRRARESSASRYYIRYSTRVRLSDHEVPMTDEREHSRAVNGQPWIDCVLAERNRWGRLFARPQGLAELREIIAEEVKP
jgi:hypothetical protein